MSMTAKEISDALHGLDDKTVIFEDSVSLGEVSYSIDRVIVRHGFVVLQSNTRGSADSDDSRTAAKAILNITSKGKKGASGTGKATGGSG